jgi:hypothetical protein
VAHVLVRHRMLIFVAKILWSTTHAPQNAYMGAPQKRFSLLVTPSPDVPWQRLLLVRSELAVHSTITLLGTGVGGMLIRVAWIEVIRRKLWNRL